VSVTKKKVFIILTPGATSSAATATAATTTSSAPARPYPVHDLSCVTPPRDAAAASLARPSQWHVRDKCVTACYDLAAAAAATARPASSARVLSLCQLC